MREFLVRSRRRPGVSPCSEALRGPLWIGLTLVTVSLFGASGPLAQAPDVVGTWEWQSAYWTDVYRGWWTPDSEGYTVQLEFRPDSLLLRFRDGILEASQPYGVGDWGGIYVLSSEALPPYWPGCPSSGFLEVTGAPGERSLTYGSAGLSNGEVYWSVDFVERPPIGPLGACCFADGHCALASADSCQAAGGTYQGGGTTCDPNPCQTLVDVTTWGGIKAGYR